VGTRYVAVSCVLGADGHAWFDNVSLEAVAPLAWQELRTRNYVFRWLDQRPFPEGAMEKQQEIFDRVCERLQVESDVVISYHLYPDSATMHKAVGLKRDPVVNWADGDMHTLHPLDDHEVVHFIMYRFGMPPRALVEGVAYWLGDTWGGVPIHAAAAYWRAQGRLPKVEELATEQTVLTMEAARVVPASGSFAGFLAEQWGPQRLIELFRTANAATSYPELATAFESVYGMSIGAAEAAWHRFLAGIEARQPAVPGVGREAQRSVDHGDDQGR
jgi:hypothetical protein